MAGARAHVGRTRLTLAGTAGTRRALASTRLGRTRTRRALASTRLGRTRTWRSLATGLGRTRNRHTLASTGTRVSLAGDRGALASGSGAAVAR